MNPSPPLDPCRGAFGLLSACVPGHRPTQAVLPDFQRYVDLLFSWFPGRTWTHPETGIEIRLPSLTPRVLGQSLSWGETFRYPIPAPWRPLAEHEWINLGTSAVQIRLHPQYLVPDPVAEADTLKFVWPQKYRPEFRLGTGMLSYVLGWATCHLNSLTIHRDHGTVELSGLGRLLKPLIAPDLVWGQRDVDYSTLGEPDVEAFAAQASGRKFWRRAEARGLAQKGLKRGQMYLANCAAVGAVPTENAAEADLRMGFSGPILAWLLSALISQIVQWLLRPIFATAAPAGGAWTERSSS